MKNAMAVHIERADLAALDRMESAIELATSPTELKKLADMAEAFRVCARKAGAGLEVQIRGWRAKALAMHRGGKMLDEMADNAKRQVRGGNRRSKCSDNTLKLSDLDLDKNDSRDWRRLAGVKPPQLDRYADTCRKERSEPTIIGLRRWLAPPAAAIEIPAPPIGQYACVVIDPPWPMQQIAREVRPDQGIADLAYPIMALDEIAALTIPSADDAHLYLWTTHRFLPDAFGIVRGWGFEYECLLTWVKNVGITPFSWMYSTEHCLFCRRGNLPLLVKGKRLDFKAPTTGHSRKPDAFYDLVRSVSPGPRIDMFGRRAIAEFTSWGAEAPQ